MDFVLLRLVFAAIISFLITFYLVPRCIAMAHKLDILDIPDGKIKTHANIIPYLGGVAIYVGFVASLALTLPFNNSLLSFILGSTLLLFVGLIDDLLSLRPYQKLFGQCIAALCFLKAGFHVKETFFLKGIWTIPVSLMWMLVVINAFNLVDVMDGLATTLAIGATISFMTLALVLQQGVVAILLGALFGALCAFLWYNRPQAAIYLGDAGSLFIGGLMATIPFLFQWGIYNVHGLIVPIIILAIPLLEVAILILVRTYKKIPFYYASPDHFSIYLLKGGWSKVSVLLYVGLLSLYLLVVSLLFILNKINFTLITVSGFIFLLIWVSILVMSRPRSKLYQN
jgi:UDP-GlcNAc:undecaprenyl-phosphate/decaprenyl-phosphate GlcNAc-1-phosphate transferase